MSPPANIVTDKDLGLAHRVAILRGMVALTNKRVYVGLLSEGHAKDPKKPGVHTKEGKRILADLAAKKAEKAAARKAKKGTTSVKRRRRSK